MKWLVRFLLGCGFLSLVSATVGIRRAQYSSSGWVVEHQGVVERLVMLAFGALLLVAGFGCAKKEIYGWYVVAALLWGGLLGEMWYALWATFTWHVPPFAIVLGL